MEKMVNNYKNKKVFVTGHTGFKGSWLVKMLSMFGAEVKGYALAPETDPSLYDILGISNLCDSVIADLRDRKRLKDEIKNFQPDYIFHLAAQAIVRTSYDIPSETFEVNVVGTANVLDGLMLVTRPCIAVLITTDKVYHNNEKGVPYKEDDHLGGYDPYSASKACCELVIDSYRNSFFNRDKYSDHKKAVISARAGNVIGGGDWAKDRLVPDIVRALSVGEDVLIRSPKSVRPWQHVIEPVCAYLQLAEIATNKYMSLSNAYNFGSNITDTLTVEEMVKLATNIWGTGAYKIMTSNKQLHEAGLLHLDIQKAKDELNWQPRWNANTALYKTVEWYKTFLNSEREIIDYTEKQIWEYLGNG